MGVVEDARYDGVDRRPWGKFDRTTLRVYSLLFHLIDVGAVAGVLWDRFVTPSQRRVVSAGLNMPQEQARSVVCFVAAMHDIGKLIPYFQALEPAAYVRLGEDLLADTGPVVHVPHARASMHVGLQLLGELGFAVGGNDSPAVRAAQCLGGHHGRFLQLDVDGAASARRVEATLGGPAWQDLRRRYARLLWHLFGVDEAPNRLSVEAAVLITGLTMVADRVASQRRYWVPNADTPSFGAAEHHSRARRQAEEEVERLGLARFALDQIPFTTAHPGLTEPTALQRSVMEELPHLVAERGSGIAVVTDAMGTGKSVAALEMARIFNGHCGTQGVAWLLPATAAADQAYEVLDRYVRAHQVEYAPVTLVHHHSDLNEAYAGRRLSPDDSTVLDGPPDVPFTDGQDDLGADDEREYGPGTAGPDRWLRGRDNALLAQYTVSTTDQAQMAVLPVRHSALRMLALSGKTVVVDEAHALDPFSQLQLLRLLQWLGALNCPVVLLSATMPASTATELVRAYLSGAGRTGLHGASFAPGYPGWLFADAATATAHRMSGPAQDEQRAAQRRTARIRVRPVTYRRLGPAGRAVEAGERLAVIADVLQAVIRHGGCAAVVCATVADAQDTYASLRRIWAGPADDLVLVHARVRGRRRQNTLEAIRRRLGPTGRRPARRVVVTTSLLDVSLDIDVDLMVSDLASVARLLQRLGRLGRFTRLWTGQERRPVWWEDGDNMPTLTVLDPVNSRGVTALPPGWDTAEPAVALHATARLLPSLEKEPLVVPDDVQALVEHVHGVTSGFAAETTRLQQMAAAHQSRTGRQEQLSAVHLVPPAKRVSSLADLHRQHLTTAQAATRPGLLPRRLLPCYRSADGTLTLDAAGLLPLPDQEHFSPRHLRSILDHSLPVPAAWVTRTSARHQPPASWKQHPLLADIVLLPTDSVTRESEHRFGHHWLRLDEELGLQHRKQQ
ncbi:CRISPR-associated endonuclease Cas3'' (plasmid) [Streptomyces sp. BB1-1-1]|uniref:CRISPR-associated endonuclease Cas3'' n=1 Tax=Streptomyces sp. BB1-1-1 TaxID=3074430 RepID=UPI002877FEA1|nr:CRISPR-associated endonuclease Cas3'' [Streptomyces sp. BB1-1-1]WND40007.1 CRISPR-associated endonuclease Cas3'' [Streptomyces sp. BB1-1-1]WND40841.1 CRISPR-associated endonuclease Cas3'' [Streptomyces sp. BB1-1-1]